jgi:hypothetical protein
MRVVSSGMSDSTQVNLIGEVSARRSFDAQNSVIKRKCSDAA